MAYDKMMAQIMERLDRIEAKLGTAQPASKLPTKRELTDIPGVGDALADKILALLKSK